MRLRMIEVMKIYRLEDEDGAYRFAFEPTQEYLDLQTDQSRRGMVRIAAMDTGRMLTEWSDGELQRQEDGD